MRNLYKSKLLSWRQCPKRLWLELHRPSLREEDPSIQARFAAGNQVGEIARRLYDPDGSGTCIDVGSEGIAAALARSAELLTEGRPVFEAGFAARGALAFADIMLPKRVRGGLAWRMVEVKSATSVKDYHRDDIAIQTFIAGQAGLPIASVALAHINSAWVYPGAERYDGLLTEADLSEDAFSRGHEVRKWIGEAHETAALHQEPEIATGAHCADPFDCPFHGYCSSLETQAEYPVSWLPDLRARAVKDLIAREQVTDMREVPDDLLNHRQQRVKANTISGQVYFDAEGAAAELAPYRLPACFLDFETVQFAVPAWAGTRPYQQIPFQFSLHRLSRTGKLEHKSFLDLSGKDPSHEFAKTLIEACGEREPIFVYNAGFETARIWELAERFPDLKKRLLAINERIVDLLPVARNHFYHPAQQGSWSIKKVLPAIAPDLAYDALDGVQDGSMASAAFAEAIEAETLPERKAQIEDQLNKYCKLDTLALVRLWQHFSGRDMKGISDAQAS